MVVFLQTNRGSVVQLACLMLVSVKDGSDQATAIWVFNMVGILNKELRVFIYFIYLLYFFQLKLHVGLQLFLTSVNELL